MITGRGRVVSRHYTRWSAHKAATENRRAMWERQHRLRKAGMLPNPPDPRHWNNVEYQVRHSRWWHLRLRRWAVIEK